MVQPENSSNRSDMTFSMLLRAKLCVIQCNSHNSNLNYQEFSLNSKAFTMSYAIII